MSLGPSEVIVVVLVALIVLGPDKLPVAARQVGKFVSEIKKLSASFQDQAAEALGVEGEKTDRPATPAPSRTDTNGFRLIDGGIKPPPEPRDDPDSEGD